MAKRSISMDIHGWPWISNDIWVENSVNKLSTGHWCIQAIQGVMYTSCTLAIVHWQLTTDHWQLTIDGPDTWPLFFLKFFTKENCQIWCRNPVLPKFKAYTQSGLIRNGPIRITSEILGFFKKSLMTLWKLRNGEITLKIFKKWITFLS